MSDTSLVFSIIGKDRTGPAMNSASAGLAKLKVAATVGFGAVAGALGKSISLASSFDKTIRQVGANSNISGAQLKEMSDLALHLGAVTSFSAQDAADAMLELSKGGLTSAQIKAGALAQTLTLAAAGELSMGDAATVMSNALATFGLKAGDAGQVAAALAGAALASTASVSSLSQGLGNVGAVARTAGLSIQQTAGILAEFDQSGIKGAEGGTQLKTVLLKLEAPTAKAAGVMKTLGIEVRDATGHLKPMGEISQILQDKLGGLSKAQQDAALKTIFGTYAIQGANIMMQNGAKGLKGYTDAANDMNAAQKMAATNTAGASGAMEQFKGSVETLGIKIGLALLPTFDKVTRKGADWINSLTDMVDPAIAAFGSIKDALAPLGKTISDALGKVDFSKLGDSLKTSAQSWAGSLISGVQSGLDNGNWGPLGKSLGSGLATALKSVGTGTLDIAAFIRQLIGKVDWFAVGKSAVSGVLSFALGFATAALDPATWLPIIRDHWKDIIGIFLTVATDGFGSGLVSKLSAKLGKGGFIAKFLGKLLGGSVKLSGKLLDGIKDIGGSIISGIAKGIADAFPRLASALTHSGGRIRGILQSIAVGAVQIAGSLVSRFKGALAGLPNAMEGLFARMTSAVLRAVTAGFKRVDSFLGGVPGRVIRVFADAGSWLFDAGKQIMSGLVHGLESMAMAPVNAAKNIGSKIVGGVKGVFGIKSPSRVMMEVGKNIVDGLTSGVKSKQADALSAVKDLVGKMKDKLQTIKDFAKQIKDSFIATADLTGLTGSDNSGGFASMIGALQQKADNATAFSSAIAQLRKMGLNETTIRQLRDAGPDAGMDAVKNLVAGGASGVSQVNALTKKIIGAGEDFAGKEAKNKYGINPYKAQPVTVKVAHTKVTIDFTNKGAESALVEAIRKAVRSRGGDVQVVLGPGKK